MGEEANFVSQLVDRDVSYPVANWVNDRLLNRLSIGRSLTAPIVDYEPEDWYSWIVDGVIEVTRVRPVESESELIIGHKELMTLHDLAIVVSRICEVVPQADGNIYAVGTQPHSSLTQQVWQSVSHLQTDEFNDQFAVKCWLDPAQAHRAQLEMPVAKKVMNFLLGTKWQPKCFDFDLEVVLPKYGYNFDACTKPSGLVSGDILHIIKDDWFDPLDQFVMVVAATNGRLDFAEFKHGFNRPLGCTADGLHLFFFRDCKTTLKGIWRSRAATGYGNSHHSP